jgi:peptidoglycan/LPS O-acetylase OafA/YrhL
MEDCQFELLDEKYELMEKSTKTYFENLDGLRAIAAIAVIMTHLSYFIQAKTSLGTLVKGVISIGGMGGKLGVIFFFILSGFLITYLLFEEREKKGGVNIGKFYLRRLLRIWPLYFLTLIFGFWLFPFFLETKHEIASPLMYSLFLANFDHILNGFPTVSILGVHWSVCVEEQFYLIWPLLFVWMKKKMLFIIGVIGFILLSQFYFVSSAIHYQGGEYHLISCFKYLCIGALVAFFAFHHRMYIQSFSSQIPKWFSFLFYASSFCFLLVQHKLFGHAPWYKMMYDLVPVTLFVYVIIDQNFSTNSLFKIGRIKLLTWLGKISYGLYLTHMIALNSVVYFLKEPSENLSVLFSGTLLISILLSYLSYTYFERYFLSFKEKFSRI